MRVDKCHARRRSVLTRGCGLMSFYGSHRESDGLTRHCCFNCSRPTLFHTDFVRDVLAPADQRCMEL